MKYIFVTGGVVSGLGKGICAASLGRLLKQCGLRVKNQKFDPYFNVDPGTMSPYQHGEVFVTDDGAETDLDLGHYERFVDESLSGNASVSSGKVFWSVLNRERQGGYLGGTVQIIPHVTDEIKSRVYAMDDGQDVDVVITRDRRHRRRHREPALPRGHPAGGRGAGTRKCTVYPRSPHRRHPRQRRAQEQAHAALREGAALRRHPAGHPRLPHATAPSRRTSAARSPCSATSTRTASSRTSRRPRSMRCRCCSQKEGLWPRRLPQARSRRGRAGHGRVDARWWRRSTACTSP